MTFDTTSSNTGHLSAAYIAIQNKLDRPILAYNFIDTARDDKLFQNVLQVVEQDRKAAPNLRRKRSTVNSDHNME